MSDIRSGYSNYVRYTLRSDTSLPLYISEPIGWNDDDLELDRHIKYHGIFTKFGNSLKFVGEAKDYIENAYKIGGINVSVRLIKEITKDTLVDGDDASVVKWVERYNGIADQATKTVQGNVLSIKFNSNDLAELIKTHENDEFEIERLDSIDDVILEPLVKSITDIKGRVISGVGESKMSEAYGIVEIAGVKYQEFKIKDDGYHTCITEIVSKGSERHSAVDGNDFAETNPAPRESTANMYFIDVIGAGSSAQVDVSYDVEFNIKNNSQVFTQPTTVRAHLVKYRWNGLKYDEIEAVEVFAQTLGDTEWYSFSFKGNIQYPDLQFNEGLMLRWKSSGGNFGNIIRVKKHKLIVNAITFYESTPAASFMFVHDLAERLMYILTGEKERFKSKFFGRTELQTTENAQMYTQDGLDDNGNYGGALIGIISGFWVRAFDPASEKYKSLKTSLKDLMDSLQVVFNIGIGIETIDFKEVLRFEEQKYFYQNDVVVRLPIQVSKEKRTLDKNLFFSGTDLGYNKGGDYENEIGLDEPNTSTSTVTPIRKSKVKYRKKTKYRADELGMEITRRKPQIDYPDEDTAMDSHNWFLDLKRGEWGNYTQVDWSDRLAELPTGLHHPQSFRSMIFTPMRILLRHGWIIRAGLEPYLNKFIKYISKDKGNSSLGTTFIGETEEILESSDILVDKLERARFLPDIVEFEHPLDEDLIDKVFGSTQKLINGSIEDVPNFYFKFEWTNDKGNIERGYLLNLKPKGAGKWKFQLANENTL